MSDIIPKPQGALPAFIPRSWITLALGRGITAVSVALMLYALSYGPVYAFVNKYAGSGLEEEAVQRFYAPLRWVAVNTPLGAPMAGYCNWWCARFGVPVYFNFDRDPMSDLL